MYGGHFMPGSLALTWALSRISLYDWTLASMVNMALLAASGLALLRLLRTLFGGRPAILVPLVVYLFCPIMLPGLAFWATTLQWLPTQLAIFMALNAQVLYVRSGRLRHAVAAAAWIAFGLLFDEAALHPGTVARPDIGLPPAGRVAQAWRTSGGTGAAG